MKARRNGSNRDPWFARALTIQTVCIRRYAYASQNSFCYLVTKGALQLLRTNRRAKLFDCIDRIKSDGLCKIQKFNDINAPLATFDRGHKRLITPQSFCELGLRQTRFLPLLNKQRDQGLLRGDRSVRGIFSAPENKGQTNNRIYRLSKKQILYGLEVLSGSVP